MPRVSVVIPCYNSSATIIAALESVRAQTFRDFEVIVVDDASSDDSAEVVNRYLLSVNRGTGRVNGGSLSVNRGEEGIRLIRLTENRGPAGARNRGIAEARGEWVAFLDADDEWLSRRLSVGMEWAEKDLEVIMWCAQTVALMPRHAVTRGVGGRSEPNAEVSVDGPVTMREITTAELSEHNPVATLTVLLRKAAAEAAGCFDPQFRGPEDYDLWIRLSKQGRLGMVDVVLARYRPVPGSLSSDDRTFLEQVLRVMDKAYAAGGALAGMPGKRRACAYQHLACAWMAAERGAMGRALRLFARALVLWPLGFGDYRPLPWGRARLLWFFVRKVARNER